MFSPRGSWVALPSPYTSEGRVDYGGFTVLIDHHMAHGTSELFVMGSAGEATLLQLEERREIVRQVVRMSVGKIPVFFGASFPGTDDSVRFPSSPKAKEQTDSLSQLHRICVSVK